ALAVQGGLGGGRQPDHVHGTRRQAVRRGVLRRGRRHGPPDRRRRGVESAPRRPRARDDAPGPRAVHVVGWDAVCVLLVGGQGLGARDETFTILWPWIEALSEFGSSSGYALSPRHVVERAMPLTLASRRSLGVRNGSKGRDRRRRRSSSTSTF